MKSLLQSRPFRPRLQLALLPAGLLPVLISIFSIGFSWPGAAAMLEGSKPKDWPAAPEKHVVSVRREAADERQSAMIAAAEAAPVPADVLRQAVGGGEIPAGEKVWWYKEELGIRIPCAITADAVIYYSDLVGKYGKQALNRFIQPTSRLDYHAAVLFHKQFEHDGRTLKDVYVVTLKLRFSQNFVATQTEGLEFQKERVVILDAAGKVVKISGDGPTEVGIMAI